MQLDDLIRNIRRFADANEGESLGDRLLLERFLETRDEAAFEELLQRHGPMVLRLCRRLLPDKHQADDAFQATFLTLVAKGDAIDKRDAVGSWLYGVAYRIATRARVRAVQAREREEAVVDASSPALEALESAELKPLLDEEVERLPHKYRAPVVLCYLEGKTNEQAAQELRCPPGTVKTRLSRARDLLRARLVKRGVALSTATLATSLENAFAASPPPAPALMHDALQAASGRRAGSPEVRDLVAGAVRDLRGSGHRKLLAAALLAVGLVGSGLGLLLHLAPEKPQPEPVVLAKPLPEPEKNELPAELGVLPVDPSLFATFRIGGLLDQDVVKKLREKLPEESTRLLGGFESQFGVNLAELDTFTHVVDTPQNYWSVWLLKPRNVVDRKKVTNKFFVGNSREGVLNGKRYIQQDDGGDAALQWALMYFLDDRAFAAGLKKPMEEMIKRPVRRRAEGNLRDAMLQATHSQNLIVIGADLRRFRDHDGFDDLVKELPLLEPLLPCFAAEALTATARVEQGQLLIDVKLVFDKKSAEQGAAGARAALKLAREVFPLLRGQLAQGKPRIGQLLEQVETALKDAAVSHDDTVVNASLKLKLDTEQTAAALAEGYVAARQAAQKVENANNLKQIALAMHVHHDALGAFPTAASADKDGKPLLSWRVAILPYIEQGPLYKQFKLDEPWDSEHNKKLLEKMPKLYAVPGRDAGAGKTFYQVFTGKDAIFDGMLQLGQIGGADGTASTVLVVEAGDGVPWTKPDDLPYAANKPLPKLGTADGFWAAFADGHVQFFKKLDDKTLRAFITPNGGEKIELPD